METTECAYCNAEIPGEVAGTVPPVDDDAAWSEIAAAHADDCEWVYTRAHRIHVLCAGTQVGNDD